MVYDEEEGGFILDDDEIELFEEALDGEEGFPWNALPPDATSDDIAEYYARKEANKTKHQRFIPGDH